MSNLKLGNSKHAIFPVVGVIAIAVVIGLIASFLVIGNLASAQVSTTTQSTTDPTTTVTSTVNSPTTVNNSAQLNAEQIYASANRSIVTLQGTQTVNSYYGNQLEGILGSGFVVSYSGANYVVTNYHVAGTTSNLTVTFSNGDAYPAKVIGSDPYVDLAIVSVQAPASEFYPLTLTSSSSLKVGDSIVAIGDPYGLTGSMTEGIISQLGRTIQDETSGNFSIANVIQFSAPINPGNSGGPLLNADGQVVGITTASVSSSQGLGFAIPSDTIIKELPSLVTNGSYMLHSYLGIGTVDMNYQLSKATGANVTYGILVEQVASGGPASRAGLQAGNQTVTVEGQQYLVGGDIIVSINGTRITTTNALGSYLASHTAAGQTVSLGIIRSGDKYMTVNVTLGARPSLS
jgi:S1-C subfamily serine protease